MFKKIAFGIFLSLTVLSVVFALRDNQDVTTNSDEAYRLYQEGVASCDKFYMRQASKELEEAVKLDSTFAAAQAELAQVYAQLGFTQKSKEMWEKAKANKQFVTEREQLLIDMLYAGFQGNPDEHDRLAEQYVANYPDKKEGYVRLGFSAFSHGNYERAVELFQKVLKIDPEYAQAYNMLGYLNYDLGRYDDALASLQQYIEAAPGEANPHDSRGEILHAIGRYDEAIAEFRQAFNINPEFDIAVLHMADSYDALGQVSQSDNCYRNLISEAQNDVIRAQVLMTQGRSYVTRFEFDSALAICSRLIAQDTTTERGISFEALFYSGVIHFRKRDLTSMMRSWQEYHSLLTEHGEKNPSKSKQESLERREQWIAATSADLKGDLDQAEMAYSQYLATAKSPTDVIGARLYYGDLLCRNGKSDLAISELQKNLSINPNHGRTLMVLAGVYEITGDLNSAQLYRQRALTIWKNADPGFKPMIEVRERLGSQVASKTNGKSASM